MISGFQIPDLLKRLIFIALLSVLVPYFTGCAAIVNGSSQQVRIHTRPEGKTFYYDRVKYNDRDHITVHKEYMVSKVNVGTEQRPLDVQLQYNPDAWLIGDCAFLLIGLIPGVVALGIDFGTGTWRDYEEIQHITVPN